MDQQDRIYVVGHRNPDSDSICSAIAYAALRDRQGATNVQPARAGTPNHQTQFILDQLGIKPPLLLSDVHPRIKDVVTEQVVSIHEAEPMAKAIELYHQHNIRALPVVDDQQRAQGVLTLLQMTELLLVPTEPAKLRRVRASLNSIRNCLQADAPTLVASETLEDFNLYVGARREVSFKHWVKEIVPEKTILITGDRPGIQAMAVEAGVRLLLLSGNSAVAPDLLERARAQGVSIMVSRYDTANCAWLTRMATPVGALIADDFLSVKPNDLLEDLRLKLTHGKQTCAVVSDGEGRVSGMATQSHLIKKSPVKLVLVDHNELSQAVPGADKVDIIEVIDHHRLGNFHTDLPIRFINQPVGSTCSLVATLYQQAGIEPEPQIAGLLLAGLLSDTVILKSPTTTDVERQLVPWLEERSGLDHQQFGTQLFAAGSPMASGAPASQLILTDFKEYQVNDGTLGIGQVEVVNFHSFYQRQDELRTALQAIRENKDYRLAALLVTDIVMETSLLLTAGPKELPYIIGYPQVGEELYRLGGVLSRKKQLVPHLLKVFKGA